MWLNAEESRRFINLEYVAHVSLHVASGARPAIVSLHMAGGEVINLTEAEAEAALRALRSRVDDGQRLLTVKEKLAAAWLKSTEG